MIFFTAVLSAINIALGFIFKSIIVKFVFYFALFFIATESIDYLTNANILPNGNSLSSVLSSLSPTIWWGLDLVAFDVVFPMILGAYVTRMILTMIPVIGPKG